MGVVFKHAYAIWIVYGIIFRGRANDEPSVYPAPCSDNPCPVNEVPSTLHEALIGVDTYVFYPLGINSDNAIPPDSGTNQIDFSLYLPASITSSHYYNVVVHLMMRYFNCEPPALQGTEAPKIALSGMILTRSPRARWHCPQHPPCEVNQHNCFQPAANRIWPCLTRHAHPETCADFRKIVLNQTSSTFPCDFVVANAAISGKMWTTCAAVLGLDDPRLWNNRNILSSLSFMFDNNVPASATALGSGEARAVPVNGPEDLKGAALAAFSFGSGYVCPDFRTCEQPGLTNTALASVAIRSLQSLGERTSTAHFFLQWETAAAAANLLGLNRESFAEGNLSKKCCPRGDAEVCVWKVGDGGSYLDTRDVYDIMKSGLVTLGITKLVQLAVPDHLPRVYRTGLKLLADISHELILYPALIPFDLNYPVTAGAALINLYADSPFLQGNDFGLFADNPQGWVRNRQLFRWYELMCYAFGGGSSLAHVPKLQVGSPAILSASQLRQAPEQFITLF